MDLKFIHTPNPIGNFVNVRISKNYAYISGQGAFDDNGKLITGKVGNPDDVAGAVYFFCSEDSKYVTGQTLLVDGGVSSTF